MIFLRALVWVLGLILEAGCAWLLLVKNQPVDAVVAHLMACVLLVTFGISGRFFKAQLPGVKVWLLGVMVTIPVFGPLSAGILLAIMRFFPQKITKEQRVVLGLPGRELLLADISRDRARSVIETLASADPEARRESILALRAEISPAAVLILQKAVGDSDEQVRNFAQSQLAKWTEKSEERIKELEKLAGEDDAPAAVLVALAEAFLEMVTNHLAGVEVEKKFLQSALHALLRVPKGSACKHRADLLALRCHLRLRETLFARAAYDRLRADGFYHPILDELHLSLLFLERHWGTIFHELREERPVVSTTILSSRNFWLSASRVA